MYEWMDERLDLGRFRRKFLRKAFPVHHSFFLGELVAFAFVTLVLTGVFLSLSYEASSRRVEIAGQSVPAAYASVLRIDTLPFGATIRRIHHWSAHVMIAGAFLHMLRVLVSGSYKRPREPNWVVGVLLLCFTVVTSFFGYALPNDAFSVTATSVGYGLALALPWIGEWIAQLFFGGTYPTPESLPRLLSIHMLWLPLILAALIGLHVLIVIKQKHTQPRYAEGVAPGSILGEPLSPQPTTMMSVLFLLYLAIVTCGAALWDPHPIQKFGPPSVSTPSVKPDWYFLWVYGILQVIPADWRFNLLGATIGPEFLGGGLAIFLLIAAGIAFPFIAPAPTKTRYLELPSDHPFRTACALGLLGFFFAGGIAGYHEQLGIPIAVCWAILLGVPPMVVALSYSLTALYRRVRISSRRAGARG